MNEEQAKVKAHEVRVRNERINWYLKEEEKGVIILDLNVIGLLICFLLYFGLGFVLGRLT